MTTLSLTMAIGRSSQRLPKTRPAHCDPSRINKCYDILDKQQHLINDAQNLLNPNNQDIEDNPLHTFQISQNIYDQFKLSIEEFTRLKKRLTQLKSEILYNLEDKDEEILELYKTFESCDSKFEGLAKTLVVKQILRSIIEISQEQLRRILGLQGSEYLLKDMLKGEFVVDCLLNCQIYSEMSNEGNTNVLLMNDKKELVKIKKNGSAFEEDTNFDQFNNSPNQIFHQSKSRQGDDDISPQQQKHNVIQQDQINSIKHQTAIQHSFHKKNKTEIDEWNTHQVNSLIGNHKTSIYFYFKFGQISNINQVAKILNDLVQMEKEPYGIIP